MGCSSATIAIGQDTKPAGELLKDRFNIPCFSVPIPIGVDATDNFIKLLMELSGNDPIARIKRWRNRLIDAMTDTHLIMAEKEIAIALEADIARSITDFLTQLGSQVSIAVIPTSAKHIEKHDTMTPFIVGDLEDIEMMAGTADLIISNSHAGETAKRLAVPLMRMGFPVLDTFGEPFRVRIGYRGSLHLLFELANILK
ncbi:MAG: hypothetical protein IEMM0008_0588 [bacterium]|nr:MAG: hypothetical protein IEMM0008_0588 [bacterium]